MNKRKLALTLVLSCVFLSGTIAQEIKVQEDIVDHKVLVLNGRMVRLPIYKNHPKHTVNLIELKKENTTPVFDEDWSNTVFNPYWKKQPTYPLELHFEDEAFAAPVEHKMVVTSRYGWRRGRPHRGIDIDLNTGDNVKSLLDGKVRYARNHRGHGKTVVIRHNNGLETVYAHLSKYLVKENDVVKKGQVIGEGGVSGNARGSHLHLEVRYMGKSIHPEYLFDFAEETKIRSKDIAVTRKWITPRSHKSTRKSKILVYKKAQDVVEDDAVKKVYVVKRGDTLYGIAIKNDIEVSEICKINSIQYNSVLNIGQEILLN
ncbi:M23 family metallopeptidase [Aquimarina sp. RZ0]|uniref:M23 family metallopeptidase n=1 Tax=Aquimarina sp. RZ0 TaxID=2607730 RepID=UPI001CB73676|nr:M23 family metallopeptidase [Aquimarina sp. RZ0]